MEPYGKWFFYPGFTPATGGLLREPDLLQRQACFDGDAWTYVPERDQYYYHYFMRQQPDLNWHNPEVKKAMWDAARFWLYLGGVMTLWIAHARDE